MKLLNYIPYNITEKYRAILIVCDLDEYLHETKKKLLIYKFKLSKMNKHDIIITLINKLQS